MTTNEKSRKIPTSNFCELCDYVCCVNKDFAKHLSTRKHLKAIETNNKSHIVPLNFTCETCNKIYKHRSSLCKHRKVCSPNITCVIQDTSSPNITCSIQDTSSRADEIEILSNLVKELVKNNQELQKHVIELCKNGTHNTTNNNNKSFNINLFLNENCKNAINSGNLRFPEPLPSIGGGKGEPRFPLME